jgi:hypothetical protein
VDVLLIGDEEGVEAIENEFEITVRKDIRRNKYGTPQLDSIFSVADEHSKQPYLCYANADMIFLSDLFPAIDMVSARFHSFLMVGRRWDLEVVEPVLGDFDQLRQRLAQAGTLHPAAGSDYFIFPRGAFLDIPAFALGRAGWDNWMIYSARAQHIPVVDATEAITAIHQDHDYGHLPRGEPHYGMHESEENIQLAGGREMIFTSRDANWRLHSGGLRRSRLHAGLARSVEASLIAKLGPGRFSRLIRLIFHPRETLIYLGSQLKAAIA